MKDLTLDLMNISNNKLAVIPDSNSGYQPILVSRKNQTVTISLLLDTDNYNEEPLNIKEIINGTEFEAPKFKFEVSSLEDLFSGCNSENLLLLIEILSFFDLESQEEKFVNILMLLKRKYSVEFVLNTLQNFSKEDIEALMDEDDDIILFFDSLISLY